MEPIINTPNELHLNKLMNLLNSSFSDYYSIIIDCKVELT